MNAEHSHTRPAAPLGSERIVDEFRAYAVAWGADREEQEAVALIAWARPSRARLIPLSNHHSGVDGFYVPWALLEGAVGIAAAWGARHVILAHTHRGGRAVPSAVFPHGDVQNLGATHWIAQVDALLTGLGIVPPLLHLICVLPDGPARLFIIDERVGRKVQREREGNLVTVPLGWREVRNIAALA